MCLKDVLGLFPIVWAQRRKRINRGSRREPGLGWKKQRGLEEVIGKEALDVKEKRERGTFPKTWRGEVGAWWSNGRPHCLPVVWEGHDKLSEGRGKHEVTGTVAPRFSLSSMSKEALDWKSLWWEGQRTPQQELGWADDNDQGSPEVKNPTYVSLNLRSEPSLLITRPFWSWWFKVITQII